VGIGQETCTLGVLLPMRWVEDRDDALVTCRWGFVTMVRVFPFWGPLSPILEPDRVSRRVPIVVSRGYRRRSVFPDERDDRTSVTTGGCPKDWSRRAVGSYGN
jgi:hypothetical protein